MTFNYRTCILGINIPKNSVYGYWNTQKSGKLVYYITDYSSFWNNESSHFPIQGCFHNSYFRTVHISKTSKLGRFITAYVLDHVQPDQTVSYRLYLHRNHLVPGLRKPCPEFMGKVSSQEQIDGRSYADKLKKHKNSNHEWDGTFDEIPFYDKGAYNGWADYK